MNFTSKVYNQSAICYAEWKKKEEQARQLTEQSTRSPNINQTGGGGVGSSNQWGLQSLNSNSDAGNGYSASVVSNSKPPASASVIKDRTETTAKRTRGSEEKPAKRTSIKHLVLRSFLTSATYHSRRHVDNCMDHADNSTKELKTETPDTKIPNRKVEPEIYFQQSLIHIHADKFKFCLVGRFGGSRPSLEMIREWIGKEWKLRGDWSVSLLDKSHIFIRLDNQADMLHVWTRNRWFVKGHLMKVFKWTPSFRPSAAEPSQAAVWVSFPALPLVFFHEELLFPIASLLGRVFTMDEPTENLTRTNVARVCMEVDLLKELPRRVFIRVGDGGFWQDVRYEKLPSYCTACCRQGHSLRTCKYSKSDSGKTEKHSHTQSKSLRSKIKPNKRREQFSPKKNDPHNPSNYEDNETSPITEGSPQVLSDRYPVDESRESECEEGILSRNASYDQITEQNRAVSEPNKMPSCELNVSEKLDYFLPIGTQKKALQEKSWEKNDSHKEEDLLQVGREKGALQKLRKKDVFEKLDDLPRTGTERGGLAEQTPIKNVSGKPENLLHMGAEEVLEENPCQNRKHSLIIEEGKEEDNAKSDSRHSPGQKLDVFSSSSCEDHSSTGRRNGSSKSLIFFWRKYKYNQTSDLNVEHTGPSDLKRYKYSDIIKMTRNLNQKLGEGGFATIFKGLLPDGRPVAIKILNPEKEFIESVFNGELETLGRTAHINVIRLLGFCSDGSRRALVLELMPNGSLDHFIHSEGPNQLKLGKMQKIAIGVARGLEFLHHQCNPSILHSDVKPGNILLDKDFCPKICDLGLSKLWWSSSCSPVPVRGTYGYIAPETFHSGRISTKSDVYGYGVTLLEMAVKRRPIDLNAGDSEERILQNWVYKNLNQQGRASEGGMAGIIEDETTRKMVLVGLWCVQPDPGDRPSMSKVLQMLEGNVHDLQMPPSPYTDMLPVEEMAFYSDSFL